jgi:membrane-bound acyltransferase YfiQ involved in biofilm formation
LDAKRDPTELNYSAMNTTSYVASRVGSRLGAISQIEARKQFIIYTALGAIILAGWVLSRLRNRLFPIGSFAFAQGKSHHELLEKFRWTVVIGLAVSILAGMIVSVAVL